MSFYKLLFLFSLSLFGFSAFSSVGNSYSTFIHKTKNFTFQDRVNVLENLNMSSLVESFSDFHFTEISNGKRRRNQRKQEIPLAWEAQLIPFLKATARELDYILLAIHSNEDSLGSRVKSKSKLKNKTVKQCFSAWANKPFFLILALHYAANENLLCSCFVSKNNSQLAKNLKHILKELEYIQLDYDKEFFFLHRTRLKILSQGEVMESLFSSFVYGLDSVDRAIDFESCECECLCCDENFSSESCLLLPCSQSCCFSCLNHSLLCSCKVGDFSREGHSFLVPCPCTSCSLSIDRVLPFLSKKVMVQIAKKYLKLLIKEKEDFIECPNGDCFAILLKAIGSASFCHYCGVEVCGLCHERKRKDCCHAFVVPETGVFFECPVCSTIMEKSSGCHYAKCQTEACGVPLYIPTGQVWTEEYALEIDKTHNNLISSEDLEKKLKAFKKNEKRKASRRSSLEPVRKKIHLPTSK